MTYTLTLKATSSILRASYFPPIDLSNGLDWSIALINFEAYNSIYNVTDSNNKLHLDNDEVVEISPGIYDIQDLILAIKKAVKGIDLRVDANTLKTEISTREHSINFTKEGSLGPLLGFAKTQYLEKNPHEIYKSKYAFNIQPVSTICVECNIATNAYLNNSLKHTIFEFFPKVGPGKKIIEEPTNPIYLPVIVQTLDYLECRITDQNDKLIDFHGDEIVLRLHLKNKKVW